MKFKSLFIASGAAVALMGAPASAQQVWTMTTTWPLRARMMLSDSRTVDKASGSD